MMKRNLFIATLGTGYYEECTYEQDGVKATKTRFIQKALLELISNNVKWGQEDEILVFMTEKAKELNWDHRTERKNRNGDPVAYLDLEQELESLELPAKIRSIIIPEGKDTTEIWEIFQIIKDEIKEDDQLYIDLTHGYRFMPMMILVLVNYLKFLKNTDVKALAYGNYEGRDKTNEVAQIINLMPLVELQAWTFAAADFERNGNAQTLQERNDTIFIPSIKGGGTKERTKEASILQKKFITSVSRIADSLMLCRERMIEDGQVFRTMDEQYDKLMHSKVKIEPAFHDIIKAIRDSFVGFDRTRDSITPYANTVTAIKWCLSKNMLQPAITLTRECIITELSIRAKRASIIENEYDKNDRDVITKCLQFDRDRYFEKHDSYDTVKELLYFEELKKEFQNIAVKRNDYNHAGTNALNHVNDVNKFKGSIEGIIKKYLDYKESLKPILINYSNHPYEQWSDEQRELAKVYGECIDVPFPEVLPTVSSEEIQKLAEKELEKILNLISDKEPTIHIMGEMTLSHVLISLLRKKGIPCIASTAKRDVKLLLDGKQEKSFLFQGFREYV